jgi:hypothetical protein
VRQPPLVAQHRVLVRAEGTQPGVEEVAEPAQRLVPGDREQPRAVVADEGHVAGGRPAVEVGAHLRVDLVLLRPPRRGRR